MKEKLCFRKYKNNSILFSVLLVVALGLCVPIGNIGYLGALLSLLGFGSVIAYNLYFYFSYKKRAKDVAPNVGTIFNWKISGHKSHWGCVLLKVDGKEYSSPNYFSIIEAESMVGKKVSYIIIDDTLLIYDILD